ncbi:hypothetical protein K8R62_03415 [bacterium]|nr:hypothetical protein [bacterium]
MKWGKIFAIFVAILICFNPLFANAAGELTLTWNWPDDNRVIGINVYSGHDSYIENHADAGAETSYTFTATDFETGIIYFSATSYDAEGNESDFAEAISWNNYLCGNGWSTLMTTYLLGEDSDADYDGDGISNEDDTDIDGDGISNQVEVAYFGDKWDEDTDLDGTINVFDSDSDNDGTPDGSDSSPLLDTRYGYVDHLYVIENSDPVMVGLTSYDVSKIPVCKCFNRTTGAQRNIIYGDADYWSISLEDRGNLDEANGNEVAVTLRHKTTSAKIVQIRDIITGEIYDPSSPAYYSLSIIAHVYFEDNGVPRLAIVGYCETTSRTMLRIYNSDRSVLFDVAVLDAGEHALDMGVFSDVDNDGSPDIAVAKSTSNQVDIINTSTGEIINF